MKWENPHTGFDNMFNKLNIIAQIEHNYAYFTKTDRFTVI